VSNRDLTFWVVPADAIKGIADRPDARVGVVILKEAQAMLATGIAPRDVLARLMVKWGAKECIEAIAAAIGQSNFRRAVEARRLYGVNTPVGWEDNPT